MGVLNGHARPIVGGPGIFADHTNVTCTGVAGKIWVCMGVPPAGPIICSAAGSTSSADCFSTPATTAFGVNDTAGMLFAVTGMCHQSANRILLPAGIQINGACRGYFLSVALYGIYGIPTQVIKANWTAQGRVGAIIALNLLIRAGIVIDMINKINTCVNILGDIPPCVAPPGGQPPVTPVSVFDEEFILASLELYRKKPVWSEDDLYIETIVMMLTRGLPEAEKKKLYPPLLKFINWHMYIHASIAADFLENEISTKTFIEALNNHCLYAQAKLLKLLGPEQFKLTLNTSPGEFYMLAEPEAVLSAYGEMFKSPVG